MKKNVELFSARIHSCHGYILAGRSSLGTRYFLETMDAPPAYDSLTGQRRPGLQRDISLPDILSEGEMNFGDARSSTAASAPLLKCRSCSLLCSAAAVATTNPSLSHELRVETVARGVQHRLDSCSLSLYLLCRCTRWLTPLSCLSPASLDRSPSDRRRKVLPTCDARQIVCA